MAAAGSHGVNAYLQSQLALIGSTPYSADGFLDGNKVKRKGLKIIT
jgi:hypothetical protein